MSPFMSNSRSKVFKLQLIHYAFFDWINFSILSFRSFSKSIGGNGENSIQPFFLSCACTGAEDWFSILMAWSLLLAVWLWPAMAPVVAAEVAVCGFRSNLCNL